MTTLPEEALQRQLRGKDRLKIWMASEKTELATKINDLRKKAFKSNDADDREAYFQALSSAFQLGDLVVTDALPFLPVQGAQLSPKDRNIAEIGGLVDTLRSMSHDDNTRACVSVNITVSNDLAKKLFDVLHAAPKAATALEAQAAELADATRRAERALAFIATLEAQLAEARKALELFEHYGCPICHGDCASANPPVYYCPMEAVRRVREGGAHG